MSPFTRIQKAIDTLPPDIGLKVLNDINNRIENWYASGGSKHDPYIEQQARYAEHMRDYFNDMPSFPIITFSSDALYHVGTLNAQNKTIGSLEAHGLSVSTHPDAWRYITHLTGQKHSISKKDNRFLDYHELLPQHKEIIKTFGIKNGWITPTDYFAVTWFDDELNQTVEQHVLSEPEAIKESQDGEISTRLGVLMTDKMRQYTKSYEKEIDPYEKLTILYAEKVLDIDGVWWGDELDVQRYSAPRGVITPNKLSEWTIKPDEGVDNKQHG